MTQTLSKVNPIWLAHLKDADEKAKFYETLKHRLASDAVTDRLKQLIQNRIDQVQRSEVDVTQYDNSGWAFKQAHLNGRRAELEIILNLLKEIK